VPSAVAGLACPAGHHARSAPEPADAARTDRRTAVRSHSLMPLLTWLEVA
jgi:hypothetical protein